MRLLLVSSLGLAVSVLASAHAQQMGSPSQAGAGNPAGSPAGTPQANQPNDADRIFVHEAAIGGRSEVELGRLAEQKGSEPVKAFGRRMVEDHTKANQQLASIAQAAHMPLPDGLDADHRTMQSELNKLSGAAFDRAYMQGQLDDHQATVQLFEYEIDSGQDPQLRNFAVQYLPVFMDHLEMARDIQARMNGQPTARAEPGTPQISTGMPGQRPPDQH